MKRDYLGDGGHAESSSLKASEAFVNLDTSSEYEQRWWGRVIFRVMAVGAHYGASREQGFEPQSLRGASWGERFFHITDPDRHELSFAEVPPRA